MGKVEVKDVEVGERETVIIDSTEADPSKDKVFTVDNKDHPIDIKAYSSQDGNEWSLKDTTTIAPNSSGTAQVDHNFTIFVKLTGICTEPGKVSVVDATLDW